jgi:O-acetyl-ADP-ribose deacetylase
VIASLRGPEDQETRDFTVRLVLDGGKTIELHGPADITQETTDAIVNAANSSLFGGGGVDGAIHDAGGPAILEECRAIVNKIGRLAAGNAVITTGGRLAAKHVVHTVGPIFRDGNHRENEVLASCHHQSIRVADEHGLSSLAFPAISTGAYGYPVHEAAPVAISSTLESLAASSHINKVRFVLFDVSTLRAYVRAAEELCGSSSISFQIEKAHS